MPFYSYLNSKIRIKKHRLRAIENLEKLRAQLDRDIPAKDTEKTLLMATWNIRDFAKKNRRGFGKRLPETWFYIAEIISRFDFVAVQEINDLGEWQQVMRILGHDWDYLATDVTDSALGGNGERLTYVFDKRKVTFQNIAGEIVLPNKMLISKSLVVPEGEKSKKLFTGKQFRRSPFMARFQAEWFKFSICTVHIYYGSESGDKLDQRVDEIGAVAKYFCERADASLTKDRGLILLGDFNIVKPEHKTMKALEDGGFTVPKALQKKTNFVNTKFYDQIAFKTKKQVIDFVEGPNNAGVFKMFADIMTDSDEDYAQYKKDALKSSNGKKKTNEVDQRKYYKQWKTYQISDHNPLWCRIDVNSSSQYLADKKQSLAEDIS